MGMRRMQSRGSAIVKRIINILKKQAKLHKKMDRLDVKFRASAKHSCEFYQLRDEGSPEYCHKDQQYTFCDRFTCPFRGDMFLNPGGCDETNK